jgi:NO-binding membrane sensor protein with MHYT domain
MHHINHFSHGLLTPVLAYLMSVVGSLLGLLLTARARGKHGAARVRWLLGAALSIGGTAIWVMHFIAMTGFAVDGVIIRYDVFFTALSAVVAIVVVGAGVLIVSHGGENLSRLLAGGLLTGIGVAGMHYLGMAALNMYADISYNPVVVALSLLIAIVAATVALWFTQRVRGVLPTTGAAMIMGIAVAGMHYTGMFGMSVDGVTAMAIPAGAEVIDFIVPLLIGISLVTFGLLMVVALSPTEAEMRSDAELAARIEGLAAQGPSPYTAPPRSTPRHSSDGRPSLFDPRS